MSNREAIALWLLTVSPLIGTVIGVAIVEIQWWRKRKRRKP